MDSNVPWMQKTQQIKTKCFGPYDPLVKGVGLRIFLKISKKKLLLKMAYNCSLNAKETQKME